MGKKGIKRKKGGRVEASWRSERRRKMRTILLAPLQSTVVGGETGVRHASREASGASGCNVRERRRQTGISGIV